MEHKPIYLDGVDVSGCRHFLKDTEGQDYNTDEFVKGCCEAKGSCIGYEFAGYGLCRGDKDCYFKQLARKTQEYEELKEEISKLQLNEYHYKNELKKYKKGIHKYRNLLRYEINNLRLSRREFLKMVGRYPKFEKDNIKLALDTFNKKLELIDNTCRYRKALEEIEEIAKDGLNPICYKSNCSRCKCYNGDDCKAGMISLINNYFTENGEFADGNGDFAEALEDLLDKERSRCNRALPVSKKILDIINKAKGEIMEIT